MKRYVNLSAHRSIAGGHECPSCMELNTCFKLDDTINVLWSMSTILIDRHLMCERCGSTHTVHTERQFASLTNDNWMSL
jgi:hypothetical protein